MVVQSRGRRCTSPIVSFVAIAFLVAGVHSRENLESIVPCQSGSAVKVGLPWPSGSEPLSSIEYTFDGVSKSTIPLDGRSAVGDRDQGEKGSKRLFQNVLRSSTVVSETRASCRAVSIECPEGSSIGFGFTAQFSSDDRSSTRALIYSNNKECAGGSKSCATTPCLGNAKRTVDLDSQQLKVQANIPGTTRGKPTGPTSLEQYDANWVIGPVKNSPLNLTKMGGYCTDVWDDSNPTSPSTRLCCPEEGQTTRGPNGMVCSGANKPECTLKKTPEYTSCLDIKTKNPNALNGEYTLSNGAKVYCDMSSDGGGVDPCRPDWRRR